MAEQKPLNAIFTSSLAPESATGFHLGRVVAELHPGKAILDGIQSPFDVEEFAAAGKCDARISTDAHAQMVTGWSRAHGLSASAKNAVYDVTWEKQKVRVVVAHWIAEFREVSASVVVADSMDVARAFTQAVCAYCNDPGQSVLLFSGGCWSRSRELWFQIQAATFDDLILADGLANSIREDFTTFLGAKAAYERYGVPHKRGVLFLGPPGNGKTHCLRAVIKMLGVPCLYVQSLKSQYGTEDSNIGQVFARARETSPCCLVLEDLDAMLTDKNRSAFLNQLDGIASLSGVLTLATTNHPERLDPAIVERPSRFDRKYHFDLPAPRERRAYLSMWNEKLDAAMRIDDAALASLVDATDGFSFAYLKELYVSSMVRWVAHQTHGKMFDELKGQLDTLRAQMKTGALALAIPAPIASDDDVGA